MDIVHHALIGGSGFLVAAAADQPIVGAAFVAGSVFPDLDVFFMAFGKRAYLRNHQGITHSLFLAPLYALGLVSPLIWLEGWNWNYWLAALFGLCLHVVLDWFNTYRIAMLSPFVTRRFSLDAVFFIDSVALVLTGAFYLGFAVLDWPAAAWLYPALFVAYFAGKWWLQRSVKRRLGAAFVIPSALNPAQFYVLAETESGYAGWLYNVISGHEKNRVEYPASDPDLLALAESSQVFRDMRSITRAFHITETTADEQGTRIVARDIAVRNFGGKFGRTVLTFDPQGNLIDEMADI